MHVGENTLSWAVEVYNWVACLSFCLPSVAIGLHPIVGGHYELNSLSFRGSLLWDTIDDEIKLSSSLEKCKKEIRSWDGRNFKCCICN